MEDRIVHQSVRPAPHRGRAARGRSDRIAGSAIPTARPKPFHREESHGSLRRPGDSRLGTEQSRRT
jgi:hypothetical protein